MSTAATEPAPVEGKVWASTSGAVGGSITAGLLLWALGVLAWGQPADAMHARQAVEAVPSPVALFLGLVLSAGATFAAGYRAKHSPRPVDIQAADELVAGPDLSVVAAALAELRSIIASYAAAGVPPTVPTQADTDTGASAVEDRASEQPTPP